jgi:hypothetical protein
MRFSPRAPCSLRFWQQATPFPGFINLANVPKRLGLLHELVPKVNRMAMLINPSNLVVSETAVRETQNAARVIGLSIGILKAVPATRSTRSLPRWRANRLERCS